MSAVRNHLQLHLLEALNELNSSYYIHRGSRLTAGVKITRVIKSAAGIVSETDTKMMQYQSSNERQTSM